MADETPQEPVKTVFRYAQIDTITGKCIGVSFLSGLVVMEGLIELSDTDEVKLGDTYADGVWTPVPTVPPPDDPTNAELQGQITTLQTESVDTMLALTEVYETNDAQDTAQEEDNVDTMLALTETYELVLQLQGTIDSLTARIAALEGGGI